MELAINVEMLRAVQALNGWAVCRIPVQGSIRAAPLDHWLCKGRERVVQQYQRARHLWPSGRRFRVRHYVLEFERRGCVQEGNAPRLVPSDEAGRIDGVRCGTLHSSGSNEVLARFTRGCGAKTANGGHGHTHTPRDGFSRLPWSSRELLACVNAMLRIQLSTARRRSSSQCQRLAPRRFSSDRPSQ